MSRDELLEKMSREYEAMESLLASLDEAALTTPGVYDGLAVRDVVAHVAAWASLQAGWLESAMRGEKVARFAPGFIIEPARDEEVMDRLNAYIFEESRDRELPDVLAALRDAHARLVAVVSTMTDEDLNDPERFDWWQGEPVWTAIAGNSYDHYAEHRALIDKWFRQRLA